MLQDFPSRPPDHDQSPEEAGNTNGHQTPIVGFRNTPRRTCSIHRGGYCCLASPQFQDFITGYTLGSSFVSDTEQQSSSLTSVEPASTILTTSASASGSTLDVLVTATAAAAPSAEAPMISAVPLVTESVSSSSSEGTMKTNFTTSDINARTRAKPTSIMVKRTLTDPSFPSLPPGLPSANHSAPSLPLTPTSVLSYSPTPVSTLAFASRSLHDLPSSSSIAAATAFANLTPKARRRTLDSFALSDENAARRDSKAVNPPYKPETLPSRFGGTTGNMRRATISSGSGGGMSYYGRDTSTARWSSLMESAKNEDNARAGLSRALNNEGTMPTPMRRKTVQIYEPLKSSPLVPKPSPSPSPPPNDDTTTTTTTILSSPPLSVSPMSLSPAPSLSMTTTQSQSQSQTAPSIVVSSAEADSTPVTQRSSSVSAPAPVTQQSSSVLAPAPVPAVLPTIPPSPSNPPPQPPQEVAATARSLAPLPQSMVPVPTLRVQPPQEKEEVVSKASVLLSPPSPLPTPPIQIVSTAQTATTTTKAVAPLSTSTSPLPTAIVMTPSTLPTATLPTPTNHVHLSRRTYIPPYKHISLLSRLFSPFSSSHGNGSSSTTSHSSSVLQPPTFTSTKHPPSSSENGSSGTSGRGVGLGRDITGTFVIDPLLVLPKGLFRAFSDDTFVGLSSTPTPSSEFIGGGGIGGERRSAYLNDSDADPGVGVGGLRLKRSRSFDGSTPNSNYHRGNRGVFSRHHGSSIAEVVGGGGTGVAGAGAVRSGEKEKEKKNLKLEVENGGIDIDVHIVPTPINDIRTRAQGMESGLEEKRTTIELTLLSPTINRYERGRGGRGGKQQQQVSDFPLIAKIHAKSPRQPIHLTARTYTPLSPPPSITTSVVSNVPSRAPSAKLVASQLSSSSPPPPPLPPPLPPSPPPPHSIPTAAAPTVAVGAYPDRPPSPTSSMHTTRTNQTTYTARTTVTSITTPIAIVTTEMGPGTEISRVATEPKRSASTCRKLKKKRPSQQQKRKPTLTPYYYASPGEAVADAAVSGVTSAGGAGVMSGPMKGVAGGGENGGLEETSAPPYTRTPEPDEPSSEGMNHRPPDPYDVINPVSEPICSPATINAINLAPLPTPLRAPAPAPIPLPIPLTSPTFPSDPMDNKILRKSNSKKQRQRQTRRSIMDNSNLTLSIPRTFHGPLTVHVQAGNLDEHIELSEALQRECVLVREGRSARGLFVGDFRKEFGFDWGGSAIVEGRDVEDMKGMEHVEGEGEGEVECVCGAREEVELVEVEKGKMRGIMTEEGKVKRRPVVEFSMTTTNGNTILHSGSEDLSPVGSTPKITLHTRSKSTPPFDTSLTTFTPTHSRSQSTPSGLPFPTSPTADQSSPVQPQAHRPSFLDVDPESLFHKTNGGGGNGGRGQIGWKVTKVQNMNGRLRVLSEHQPIMKSPVRNGGALIPPVPPLPKSQVQKQTQTQTQTPGWVVPKSVLPSNGNDMGSVKERRRSMSPENGNGDVRVQRLSIQRKVFSSARGWQDWESPTKTYANGEVGGGDAENGSSSGGGGGSGSVEDVRRRRRASAPVTSTETTNGVSGGVRRKCTCGANDTRTRSATASGEARNTGVNTQKAGSSEWMGDRIDISIGRGKVRLLYDDESVDVFIPIGDVGVVGVVKKEKRWWKFGKDG